MAVFLVAIFELSLATSFLLQLKCLPMTFSRRYSRSEKLKNNSFFAHLFASLRCLEDRLHLGNENKSRFILHFARFALSLQSKALPRSVAGVI